MTGSDRAETCCFTGHRPDKLPFVYGNNRQTGEFMRLASLALYDAYEKGYRTFITGMCEGFDLWAAEIVLQLKSLHGDIRLEAALPYERFGWKYHSAERTLFLDVLRSCDAVTVLCPEYIPACFQMRNRYMVDRSSLLIAAYNGTPGGTRNTVAYALHTGCRIRNILDPDFTLQRTESEI